MLKIGIAVDGYKLPVFYKHLKNHNLTYEEVPFIESEDTFLLTIKTIKTVTELQSIIEAAEKESQKKKRELKRERNKSKDSQI